MKLSVTVDTIQLRRGKASALARANPLLADGEPCYETDTQRLKVGDGIRHYNSLPYIPAVVDNHERLNGLLGGNNAGHWHFTGDEHDELLKMLSNGSGNTSGGGLTEAQVRKIAREESCKCLGMATETEYDEMLTDVGLLAASV